MAKRAAKSSKTAIKRRKGDPKAGNGGVVPPVEHQFKPGNPGGPGRPRTISELRELVQALGNETLTEAGLTRLQAMLRTMFASKNAADKQAVLEYGWGKVVVPVEVREPWQDDIIAGLKSGAIPPEVVARELPDLATQLFQAAGVSVKSAEAERITDGGT